MAPVASMPTDSEPPESAPRRTSSAVDGDDTDEALMRRVRARDERALQRLYRRHAGALFRVASRSLGEEPAREIVQDVLWTAWTKADTYDETKGAVLPWLLGIVRRRASNRRRDEGRRPQGDAAAIDDLPDAGDDDRRLHEIERARALDRAFASLPEREQSALRLAFFDELSHDEVARALGVPMGTAKTRIRAGMKRLRPILLGLGVTATVIAVLLAHERIDRRRDLDERALRLVTASDVRVVHLFAAPGLPEAVHGNLRVRAGAPLGVLTCSNLPVLDRGETYRAWARVGEGIVPLGEAERGDDGKALVLAEDPRLSRSVDEVFVTRETRDTAVPTGPRVVQSSAP
jgi:RNA polymerase sigma-70 factor (ECF subfamily)